MRPYSLEELSRSVYYPACGLDLRPIAAFSHVSDLFIYVDWDQGILDSLAETLHNEAQLGQYLQVVDEREVPIGLGQDPPDGFGMTAQERDLYRRGMRGDLHPAFRLNSVDLGDLRADHFHRRRARQGVTELTLRRQIGGCTRRVRLLLVPGDAIGAYCYFYLQGMIAPRVLITTQQGMIGPVRIEEPDGVMARLIQQCQERPLLWARPTGDFTPEDFYNTPVQGPRNWCHNGSFYREPNDGNSVTVYRCSDTDLHLRNHVVLADEGEVTLDFGIPTAQELQAWAVVFLKERQRDELDAGRQANCICYPPRPFATLAETLDFIGRYCQEHGIERAATISCGYEDEGDLLRYWVRRNHSPRVLQIWFPGEFDFADLRRG